MNFILKSFGLLGLNQMILSNYIYVKNFFTKEECNRVIDEGEKNLEDALLLNKGKNTDVRDTQVSFIYSGSDVQDLMQKVVNQIIAESSHFYKRDVHKFEAIQYTKYEKDMFYKWHTDSASNLEELENNVRDMSASLVLSPREEYEGGSLQMILNDCIDRNNVVTPHDVEDQEQGTLIIFPSNVLHQVTPVTSGVRKSLVSWSRC